MEELAEGEDRVTCVGAEIVGENIVARAAAFLRARDADLPPGIAVTIRKLLPPGSGVGAGSGNAAALARAYGAGDDDGLISLGADVAFLASGHALALASGAGERLEPIDGAPDLSAVIFFTDRPSPTAEAYRALDALRGSSPVMPADEAEGEAHAVLGDLAAGRRVGLLPNDFSPCFDRECFRSELYAAARDCGALAWGLCGSGSAGFALFGPGEGTDAMTRAATRDPRFERVERVLVCRAGRGGAR